ncbi:MAG: 50S ribosomal protein L22 [Candidatus Parcubacteria bacterium]|nr:MAG: 50S ribosomal protein L22 [Candidatus Parcubacteria bacterium]
MTIATASLNYLRMSPRKVRVVAKIIKNLPVEKAEKELLFRNKKAAKIILKLLKSAISNARNKGYEPKDLYIKNIIVNEGPKNLKRYYPKARGRVGLIIKKMSHLKIELDTTDKHG